MGAFVRNTKTFFNQTSAPTGWTKITNQGDDCTLRVVSGTSGGPTSTYGLQGVSSALVDSTWSGTITGVSGSVATAAGDLPSHNHTYSYETATGASAMGQYPGTFPGPSTYFVTSMSTTTSGTYPGPSDHNHGVVLGSGSITSGGPTGFAVKYIDFILASKA
jgi:hypothetical protein